MSRILETRLRRVEQRRSAIDPANRMSATMVFAEPSEDVNERVAASGHRDGWPLLIVRADWQGARPQ